MISFNSIVKDIKALKIQGANNVAKAAVRALEVAAYENRHHDIMKVLSHAKEILFKSRPTEPCMRNAVNFVLSGTSEMESLHIAAEKARQHFEMVESRISEFAARKVKDETIVFTHCHSSSVTKSLILARKHRKFIVHNTETRPKFQGRITAKELLRAGIPVVHYVDSAARLALRKADIMVLGADAITTEGKVINKIGSELFAEVAEKFDVPVYICADSWKFDPLSVFGYEEEIEERSPREVWLGAPKDIKIHNYAFEKIDSDLITGIISELGVYKPDVFVEEVKKNYPWMF